MNITNQFIQRNYGWEPDWIAYMSSISLVLVSLSSMTFIPVMSKVIGIADVKLAILGFVINFTCNVIKGTWLSENGKQSQFNNNSSS